MKNLVSIIVLCIGFSVQAFAQDKTFKSLEEVRPFSMKIAELFKEGKIEKAVKKLRPYWPLPEEEITNFEKLTTEKIALIDQNYGEPFAVTKINEKSIQNIAFQEIYFVQYDLLPIRVIFTYYRGKDGWMVNSFKWDDDFRAEFE